jgi:two-component system NtrC family response regulator
MSLSRASSQDEASIEQMLIGNSAIMHNVQDTIRQVAHYPDTTVLLQGESGTGKEVVARAIHLLSRRASYQFVPINCAAIPDTLLETELFGVEAGAFTDAKASRDGYVLRADGGTLFLDEIGAMPFALQAKLLRFLETRSFRRIGGTKELHVDLRVVSATNLDLKTAVAQKIFRDDLFYRLQVITIHLPALRERREDIPLLVEHYLQKNSTVHSENGQPLKISADTLTLLERYDWPGNVRELFSVLQHSSVLCDGVEICPQNLPENVRLAGTSASERLQELRQQMHLPAQGIDLPAFLSSIESTFIREALELSGGNQVQAAALLGMSRDKLRYRLSRM